MNKPVLIIRIDYYSLFGQVFRNSGEKRYEMSTFSRLNLSKFSSGAITLNYERDGLLSNGKCPKPKNVRKKDF